MPVPPDPSTEDGYRFDDLRALFINCTLKPSPHLSHTQGLIDKSRAIMDSRGGPRSSSARSTRTSHLASTRT